MATAAKLNSLLLKLMLLCLYWNIEIPIGLMKLEIARHANEARHIHSFIMTEQQNICKDNI